MTRPTSGIEDDRLRLIFTCCHPALPLEGRVALTLRTLAGLTTAEIARAFLVPEPTMAKRLVAPEDSAPRSHTHPPAHLCPSRLGGVFAVLYLLFNEVFRDLRHRSGAREPERRGDPLARTLAHLMPDEPEALGLLADAAPRCPARWPRR
ncbi:MAG: DUF6596 domain-containing protein [Thermomicrobiales bacterium]